MYKPIFLTDVRFIDPQNPYQPPEPHNAGPIRPDEQPCLVRICEANPASLPLD
jgi:hypothetical protein